MAVFQRGSGVLLHPTALPGPHGIGTLGAQALAFLDWLEQAGQGYWQICPLVPTGYGDSPYQGFSAFAGNPNLIDLTDLMEMGLLEPSDAAPLEALPSDRVDFGRLIPAKSAILLKAWRNFRSGGGPAGMAGRIAEFRDSASWWLEDYALFMVLKDLYGGRPWDEWDEAHRLRKPEALERTRGEYREETDFRVFVQYLFNRQWKALKASAGDRGIRIIGDLPIFIAYDSSDCWARPELFQLDENRRPTHVAGVPPDYFSSTGQLWGNPLYDWDAMERNGFRWWISVLRDKLDHYDVLRIDHFRGFSAYWSVPFGETTAINGRWVESPGSALFDRVRRELGDIPVIAEDLGVITEDVVQLMKECGFPGMKVLQFAFDSSEENDYLPHTYDRHSLVYTGTHDNDTASGWFDAAPRQDREMARRYLNLPPSATGRDAARGMVRAAMASVSELAVTPVQDILGLGSEARFNTPGTLGGGNWTWRIPSGALDGETAAGLKDLSVLFGRCRG